MLSLSPGHWRYPWTVAVPPLLPVHHTAGSVDTGTDLEDDITDRDLLSGQSADIDNPFQPEAGVAVQLLQPVIGEDAVLSRNRDDIRGDTDRRQLQQLLQIREREIIALGERLHELESYSATR